jgi:hypothetical protein
MSGLDRVETAARKTFDISNKKTEVDAAFWIKTLFACTLKINQGIGWRDCKTKSV